MNKAELKAALGRIEPDEDLIESVLLKINERGKTEKKRYNIRGYAFAGIITAVMALVILPAVVICVKNILSPSVINQPNCYAETQISRIGNDINEDSAVMAKGTLKSYDVQTSSDREAFCGIMTIEIEEIFNGLNTYNINAGDIITAKMYFDDLDKCGMFTGLILKKVYFSIMPEEINGEIFWRLCDFAEEEVN